MAYRGVGAGPGPVETYKVDAPFPWGDNTEIKIPVQVMVDDAWAAAYPHLLEFETKLIGDMEDEANFFAPDMVQRLIDTKLRPEVQKQMEMVFAKVDLAKEEALKAAIGIAAGLSLAIGLGAWWVTRKV